MSSTDNPDPTTFDARTNARRRPFRCQIGWFKHRKTGSRVPAYCRHLTCPECRPYVLDGYEERLRPFAFAPSILTLAYPIGDALSVSYDCYTKSASHRRAALAALKPGFRAFMRFVHRSAEGKDMRFAWCRRLRATTGTGVILTDLILLADTIPEDWREAARRNGFHATSTRSDDVITDWVHDRLARSAADTRLPAHARRAQTNCPKLPTAHDWWFVPLGMGDTTAPEWPSEWEIRPDAP